jgi:hypothetical protein
MGLTPLNVYNSETSFRVEAPGGYCHPTIG